LTEDDVADAEEDDNDEEDNLDEIDLNNIVEGGRRTRGKVIDFAKAAEKAKQEAPAHAEGDEDEDDEDDDYEAPDEVMAD
jgi:hypothetical protein